MEKGQSIESRLRFYAVKRYNVLLEGTHGIGKTSIIENIFQELGWRYLMLNAATIDPYLDFYGIPKQKTVHDGDVSREVMTTILPESLECDEIDAIFFDEINRGSPEILNGLLDLIQFKSIKNKKLNKLKVVWAAQNPYNPDLEEHEQTYNVKPLDPALKDRFHIFISLPTQLNKTYLKKKHQGLYKPFAHWWGQLPEELKYYCSPRRIDYAIQIYKEGGLLEDVLDEKLPIKQLKKEIDEFLNDNKKAELTRKINALSIEEAKNVINIENIENVMEIILNQQIPIHYLQSINQDVLFYFLNKSSKEYHHLVRDYANQHPLQLNEESKMLINKDFYTILTYINKNMATIRSDDFKSVISCFLNAFLEYHLIEKTQDFNIKTFFNAFVKSPYYKSVSDNIMDIQKNILLEKNQINQLSNKAQKTQGDLTQLFQHQKQLNNIIKKYLDNKNLNHLENMVLAYIYIEIVAQNAQKEKEYIINIMNKIFMHPDIENIFKQSNNLFYSLFVFTYPQFEQELNHIIQKLFTKSNNYQQIENNIIQEPDMFSKILFKINQK